MPRPLCDQLARALAQEKETPTKEAALAVDEALGRLNAIVAAETAGRSLPAQDEVSPAASTSPPAAVESEPNNVFVQATSMSTALLINRYMVVTGAITPANDLDFYSFTAPANSRIWVLVDTGGTQNPGSNSRDTVLDLLAVDGTTVIESDDDDGNGNGGDGTNETGLSPLIAGKLLAADGDPERDAVGTDLVLELRNADDSLLLTVDSSAAGFAGNPPAEGSNFTITADGMYYIRVRHDLSNGTGSYDLLVAVSVRSETEPNDFSNAADTITFSPLRCAIINGAINPAGDADYFVFTAAAGSRVWITIDTGGTQNSGANARDSLLDLLAADGVTVIESDNDDGTGNGGDGTIESGQASNIGGLTLAAGGTYYIRVRAVGAASNINPYRLFVVLTSAVPVTEVEGNNTMALANPIVTMASSFGLRSGGIDAMADVDYYSVVGKAGTVLYFNADAAYTQAGLSPPAFTDPSIVASSTPIKAVHVNELRSAVIALESS